MRIPMIALVGTGVGLAAWLVLRGGNTPSAEMKEVPPKSLWLDALGSLTSPLAPAVRLPPRTFDLSGSDAKVALPPGEGPRVVRFQHEDGSSPILISFAGRTLYLLPEKGPAPAQPCTGPLCPSSQGRATLVVPDQGGDVTLARAAGARVRLVP